MFFCLFHYSKKHGIKGKKNNEPEHWHQKGAFSFYVEGW